MSHFNRHLSDAAYFAGQMQRSLKVAAYHAPDDRRNEELSKLKDQAGAWRRVIAGRAK